MFIATAQLELRKAFARDVDDVVTERKTEPPKHFTFDERHVGTLAEMRDLMVELVERPTSALVLGRPLIAAGERKKAHFEDEPSDFWFIDLDGAPVSDGESPRQAIERLLPFLAGRAFVFAFTQSASFKPGLRLRIVCRVAGKTLAELAAFAREVNSKLYGFHGKRFLDGSIYQESRLIFTARPRLSGLPDPHPERVFLVEGDERPVEITVPKLVEIRREGDVARFDALPVLRGNWAAEGEGHERSLAALKGIGLLRTFMGDRWEDQDERERLWLEMLTNAGASADSLERYGVSWLRRRWREARLRNSTRTHFALANEGHEVPVEEAAERLRATVTRIVENARPGVYCISVSAGTGKTREVLRQLARFSTFSPDGHHWPFPLNIDFYAPTVRMAEEALSTAERFGLRGFVEYGRGQTVSGTPVCIKADAAKAIQGIVGNVAELLCKSDDGVCEHYAACRWQWQREQTADRSLRVRAHNYLPITMRSEQHVAYRPVDFVVIDEASFVHDLLHDKRVELVELLEPGRLRGEHWQWVLDFARVLDGDLTLSRLEEAGLTAERFEELARAEAALQPRLSVTPAMSPGDTMKALRGCDDHAGWYRFAQVWRQLAACFASRSMNRVRWDGTALFLSWKSPIKSIPWDSETGRPKVPVVVLSATMRREVIEQFLPVDEWHEIEAAKHPGARIVMQSLRGSKSESLYGATEERIEDGQTDADLIAKAQEVRAEIAAACEPGDVLITYKELEAVLAVETSAHFYAVEGLNEYERRNLVVYGRPLPAPRQVEDVARGVFCDGAEIPSLRAHWYPSRLVQVRGQQDFAAMPHHPDERVEAVRWMICEGEVMQALARARYVRHPVQIKLLNQMALPLAVDEIRDAGLPRRRAARSRVLPVSTREMCRVLGFLDERSAARALDHEAWARDRLAPEVRYRRPGARGPMARAFLDGWGPQHLGFETTAFEVVDSPHTRWALTMQQLEDFLAREGLELEDACDFFDTETGARLEIGFDEAGVVRWRRQSDDEWRTPPRWPWAEAGSKPLHRL
jgi:hypothetical protein